MKKHSEVSANLKLKHLKKIGVDLESAIFNGFSNIIPTVSRLVCVHHLKKRDESKLLNLLVKTRKSAAERNQAKGEIVKDIYGSREGNYYPDGIYLFKVNNRNTRTRCEICSKLTIKTPERRQ